MLSHAFFRADALPSTGAGHVMRCLALAQHMHEAGVGCSLITVSPEAAAAERWRDAELEVLGLGDVVPGSTRDAEETVARIANETGVLIADSYAFDKDYLSVLQASGLKLAVFDDLADRPLSADWVINQNPGADVHFDYAELPNATLLLGADYVVLRQGIKDEVAIGGAGLLITMGGSDLDNLGLQAVKALLAKGADFPMHLICSAPQAGFDEAVALAGHYETLRVSPPGPIERHMINADAALCAGGVTSLELAHLGVASVALIIADNQRPGALALGDAGAALAVETLEAAADVAYDLMHNTEQRHAMAQAGRALIDGQGAARILNSLMDCAAQ